MMKQDFQIVLRSTPDLSCRRECHNASARVGVSLKGTTAYVTWPPCSRCTRSLIQAGVNEVVFPKVLEIPERWQEDFSIAMSMMSEANITVRQV